MGRCCSPTPAARSEEHTSELQSRFDLVCRLLPAPTALYTLSLHDALPIYVELGQIGEIKKNATVVMRVKTGKAVGYPLLRWRGIALSTFDGKRWTTPHHHHGAVLQPDSSG